jgi:hypothetical protein
VSGATADIDAFVDLLRARSRWFVERFRGRADAEGVQPRQALPGRTAPHAKPRRCAHGLHGRPRPSARDADLTARALGRPGVYLAAPGQFSATLEYRPTMLFSNQKCDVQMARAFVKSPSEARE